MISYEQLCMEIERWHSLQAADQPQGHQPATEAEPDQHPADPDLAGFDELATGAFAAEEQPVH